MKKIIISLLTHQIMPNILFCLEMSEVDIFVFVYTDESENALNSILDSNILPSKKIRSLKTDATNIIGITETLSNSDFDTNDKYFINLTGGTKIMSIAFYKYFNNFPKVSMYYLDKFSKTYQKIHPYPTEAKKHKYSININEYLSVHGLKILGKRHMLTRRFLFSKKYFEDFISKNGILPEAYESIKALRKTFPLKEVDDTTVISLENIREGRTIDSLKAFGFLRNGQTSISGTEWKYLNSAWLEEYVYGKVLEKSKLGKSFIAHNVHIQYENHEQKLTKQEMDVFFMHNCTPYCIECKTVITSGADFSAAIFKLNALKKILGLDLKLVLVVLADIKKRFKKQAKDDQMARAEKYEITVIDKVALKKGALDQYLDEIFGK